MKHCTRCLAHKRAKDFYLSRKSADGRSRVCGKCTREVQAAWREDHREEEADRLATYRAKNHSEVVGRCRVRRKAKPNERRAHDMLYRAIKRGDMPKPTQCAICKTTERKIHYHQTGTGMDDWKNAVPVCMSCSRRNDLT
jgi:hypothetical protein